MMLSKRCEKHRRMKILVFRKKQSGEHVKLKIDLSLQTSS